jgi:cytosine/uracil/thiamine/allantoin permease
LRSGGFEGLGSSGSFVAVFSIMVGYFAAVVINFSDFARFMCPSSCNWNKEWADLKEHQVHLVGLY